MSVSHVCMNVYSNYYILSWHLRHIHMRQSWSQWRGPWGPFYFHNVRTPASFILAGLVQACDTHVHNHKTNPSHLPPFLFSFDKWHPLFLWLHSPHRKQPNITCTMLVCYNILKSQYEKLIKILVHSNGGVFLKNCTKPSQYV